jgi:hypothetical protein
VLLHNGPYGDSADNMSAGRSILHSTELPQNPDKPIAVGIVFIAESRLFLDYQAAKFDL